MNDEFKDEAAARLRRLVLIRPGLRKTDSAEAGLTTLSFQSLAHPGRSVWVDTDLNGRIVVDLEDKHYPSGGSSVAHVVPHTEDAAVAVIESWLSGAELGECLRVAPLKE